MHQLRGADTGQQQAAEEEEGRERGSEGGACGPGRLQREEREEEGTAAVWASSLLARLLKVIIEFLCRASPPCGTVLGCELDGRASERARERGAGEPSRAPDLKCDKRRVISAPVFFPFFCSSTADDPRNAFLAPSAPRLHPQQLLGGS